MQRDTPAKEVAEKLQTVLAKIERDSADLCTQLHLSLTDSATSSLQHLLLYAETAAAVEVGCLAPVQPTHHQYRHMSDKNFTPNAHVTVLPAQLR